MAKSLIIIIVVLLLFIIIMIKGNNRLDRVIHRSATTTAIAQLAGVPILR